jgi:hypothetical protein
VVVSSLGARFEYVGQTLHSYGIPQAVKLSPPEDAYSLTLPSFRDELEDGVPFDFLDLRRPAGRPRPRAGLVP